MSILSKLYTGNRVQAMHAIVDTRRKQGFCVVHFVYFALLARFGILKHDSSTVTSYYIYHQALLTADYILPDGIALQLFYFFLVILRGGLGSVRWLHNCNGTDFTLPFLIFLRQHISDLIIHIYGGKSAVAHQTALFLQEHGFVVGVVCDGYGGFDRSNLDYSHMHVLLVARGTPLQEQRTYQYRTILSQYKILVITVGGLFDFRTQAEKRAPVILRGRAEWLWRFLLYPKKNAKKVRYSLSLPYYILYYLLLKR